MNANERTADALINRANANIAQLISRFESIIAYEPDTNHDRNVAAVSSYQMGVESAAMVRNPMGKILGSQWELTQKQVRAAEDILSLTRVLKEAWLFGRLETVGEGHVEERTRAASGRVVEGLVRLGVEGWGNGGAAEGGGAGREGEGAREMGVEGDGVVMEGKVGTEGEAMKE